MKEIIGKYKINRYKLIRFNIVFSLLTLRVVSNQRQSIIKSNPSLIHTHKHT